MIFKLTNKHLQCAVVIAIIFSVSSCNIQGSRKIHGDETNRDIGYIKEQNSNDSAQSDDGGSNPFPKVSEVLCFDEPEHPNISEPEIIPLTSISQTTVERVNDIKLLGDGSFIWSTTDKQQITLHVASALGKKLHDLNIPKEYGDIFASTSARSNRFLTVSHSNAGLVVIIPDFINGAISKQIPFPKQEQGLNIVPSRLLSNNKAVFATSQNNLIAFNTEMESFETWGNYDSFLGQSIIFISDIGVLIDAFSFTTQEDEIILHDQQTGEIITQTILDADTIELCPSRTVSALRKSYYDNGEIIIFGDWFVRVNNDKKTALQILSFSNLETQEIVPSLLCFNYSAEAASETRWGCIASNGSEALWNIAANGVAKMYYEWQGKALIEVSTYKGDSFEDVPTNQYVFLIHGEKKNITKICEQCSLRDAMRLTNGEIRLITSNEKEFNLFKVAPDSFN